MYRILVVDDEPISADGITEYLREYGPESWQLQKAYMPLAALEMAAERIDVLVTDITMPGMDGYELFSRVLERWPRCKVIYLTGNVGVDYAQRAIRLRVPVDYVLKTESESQVLDAVHRAIDAMTEELRAQDFQQAIQERFREALPLLRNALYGQLLRRGMPQWHLERRMEQLEVQLSAAHPILLAVGFFDGSQQEDGDMSLVTLDSVMSSTLNSAYRWDIWRCEDGTFTLLMQNEDMCQCGEKAGSRLLEYMELVQQSMSRMGCAFSMLIDSAAYAWEAARDRYRLLSGAVSQREWLPEALLVLNAHRDNAVQGTEESLRALRAYLLAKKEEAAMGCLQGILFPRPASLDEQLQLYNQLISFYVAFARDTGIVNMNLHMPSLRYALGDEGWDSMADVFMRQAAFFVRKQSDAQQPANRTVQEVNRFIQDHLGEDLSLSRVAALIFHSPTYFSRLYKHVTGIGYTEYVTLQRMEQARKLLGTEGIQVQEIAKRVGYDSVSYFIRAFRKAYGQAPSEYRREMH